MSRSPQSFHAVVVGGGLVGKSAALALSQAGLRVALLAERASATDPASPFDSRIYALAPSTQSLLERLRVWPALSHECLGPVREMQVFGDAFGQLRFSAFESNVEQLAWIAESSRLERALDAALGFSPQLAYLHARAVRLDVNEAHEADARLELDDGTSLRAALVVGADGAQSWVREQCGIAVRRRDYHQTGVVANFHCEKPHRETAWQWFRGSEVFALLPLPGNHLSLVWSASNAHAQTLLALTPQALADEVERRSEGRFGALRCVTPARGFPLALQTAERLIAARVALVGDAAHLIHPLAGQGVNLGLRDVAALAAVLRDKESFRDAGDPVLLRRYERSRREDIQALTIATDGLQRLFSIDSGVLRMARNVGMNVVGKQTLLKRWLVAQALG